MKVLFLLLSLTCTVFALLDQDSKEWIYFKSLHGKLYKNQQEEELRLTIFQENLRTITEHNKKYVAGETTYSKGVTYFADLTKEEIAALFKKSIIDRPTLNTSSTWEIGNGLKIPEDIDWRELVAVSKVKNQGDCASGSIYSVIGTLEGFNFVKTKTLVPLSAQQLVDCSSNSEGCSGGNIDTILEYVKENGVEAEAVYPDSDDLTCKYDESAVIVNIKDFVYVESKNEDKLLTSVGFLGPISVAIDATELVFYQGGVFQNDDCSSDVVNHNVLAVGYDADENTGLEYWILKNSWGTGWGEDGYFKIKRGSNECGIANNGIYPILN